MQTSTVTVAVMPEPTELQLRIDPGDLEFSTCRGSGAGGQKRNKTESAVVILHVPTGLQVRCETERSQYQNKASALALLRARLWESERSKATSGLAMLRKQQIGSGQRGDKRRTIAVQRDEVVDHVTGRRWSYRDYYRGNW